MSTELTDAWILRRGPGPRPGDGALEHVRLPIGDVADDEVLVEPLFGCWEANMSHAMARDPLDVCAMRGEDFVVLGNAGVVRVLRTGRDVTHTAEGDLCVLYADVVNDDFGYPLRVLAYDAPGTRGLLARRVRLPGRCLIPVPANSTLSAAQWAAMSVRYITAWDNWRVAYGCWRVQMPDVDPREMNVWSWGGGVGLAQLSLARRLGCRTAMLGSSDSRLARIAEQGITPIDRRSWPELHFDPAAPEVDPERHRRFKAAEKQFLARVAEETDGRGVDIFIDNIGQPVFRTTVKALARQGVVTTMGWKLGTKLQVHRAAECIARHIHVHTHGSSTEEAQKAVMTAEEVGFRPPVGEPTAWEDIPRLAANFAAGKVDEYFPIYQVNPL